MDSYVFYNDIDDFDSNSSTSSDNGNDDVVVKKLASYFYWEDGIPDFSLPWNRDALKQRMYESARISMQFEGPMHVKEDRYPEEDSIEVQFKIMHPSQKLGQYNGTPRISRESGSIRNLRKSVH